MITGMSIPTDTEVERLRQRAQRLCDIHRMALRSMPIELPDAEAFWLGKVETTRMDYVKALDAYTAALRLRVSA
jgi:hypothetical protein